MVATDSEVRFRPANRVGRSAHRAPAAKPASSASPAPRRRQRHRQAHNNGGQSAHQHLSLTADVENTALEGHRRTEAGHDQRQHICQHIQKALGAAERAGQYVPVYDQRIPSGKPYGQTEQHQRQNQRKQRQSNPCFFHSVPPCADDMSLPIRCGAEGQAGLQPRQRVKKSLAEFAARRRQKIKIIFSRDMCVRENTSQAASVEFVRHGRANYARSRLQAFCRKTRRVFRQSRGAEGQIGLQPRVGFTPPSTPLLLQWCWGPRWCRP